jgi:hypothetical protein
MLDGKTAINDITPFKEMARKIGALAQETGNCSRGWQKGLRWGSEYESTFGWRSRRVTA